MKKYTEFLKERTEKVLEKSYEDVKGEILEEFKKLDEKGKLEMLEEMKKMLNETKQSEGSGNIERK